MAVTVHVSVQIKYHQQDNGDSCGEACAQMVLSQRTTTLFEQDVLGEDIRAHSVIERGWSTAPDGLTWTLNSRLGAARFALTAAKREDEVSRTIVCSINDDETALPALVYGSKHWVVVLGYSASRKPQGRDDTGYAIGGFDINNPWPPTPHPRPPAPHAVDDVCGTGGARGVADEHVSYNTWQADYMTGITQAGHWKGTFVAVCSSGPPASVAAVARKPRRRPARDVPYQKPGLVPSSLVPELVDLGLENAGLKTRDRWREALDSARPGKPALVQRLDRADSFYWMVPLARSDQACAYANVDALTGEFQQARAVREKTGTDLLTMDDEQTQDILYNRTHPLPNRRGELRIRRGFAAVSPHWVWAPCLESLSPYYPFKVANYGPHRLYLRSDGQVFTRLTAGRGGMGERPRVVAR